MIILALDPAEKCGWAHSNGQFGVFMLKLQGSSLGEQHAQLEKYLERAIELMGCEVIATENAGFGSPNPEVQARHNERLGIIRLVAARHGLNVQAFQPSTIKLYATGDGHAKKPAMVAAAKRHLGITVTSDDEADAIWILELMKRPDCWPDSAKGIKKKKGKRGKVTTSKAGTKKLKTLF